MYVSKGVCPNLKCKLREERKEIIQLLQVVRRVRTPPREDPGREPELQNSEAQGGSGKGQWCRGGGGRERIKTVGEVAKKTRVRSRDSKLEEMVAERPEAHSLLADPKPPPPQRRSWAESDTEDTARKHLPPKAPSVPRSPATATRAFCLSDLQLPGYRRDTPYTAAENRAGVTASECVVPSRPTTPRDCLLNSPPLASRLRPGTRAQGWTHPLRGSCSISYWLLVTREAGGPSPCPHGKCSFRSLEAGLPGGIQYWHWRRDSSEDRGIVGDGVKYLLSVYPQFLSPVWSSPEFRCRRAFWVL